MQKIIPNLWFDEKAEEATDFYVSVFTSINTKSDSKILSKEYYGEEGSKVSGMKRGSLMTVSFKLEGQEFLALNGGPAFSFTPAISFIVNCEDQKEIDQFWQKLTEGGKEVQCGWLEDKYGMSWQIVPTALNTMFQNKEKAEKVIKALVSMKKIDIEELRKAYK